MTDAVEPGYAMQLANGSYNWYREHAIACRMCVQDPGVGHPGDCRSDPGLRCVDAQ